MPADIEKAQKLIEQLNEEIYQWGYTGFPEELRDGDTHSLNLYLVGPDGQDLEYPITIILPRKDQ